jgi:hypothetical protein
MCAKVSASRGGVRPRFTNLWPNTLCAALASGLLPHRWALETAIWRRADLGPGEGRTRDSKGLRADARGSRVEPSGEGAPFTGLKPADRDLGPAIPAADEAVRVGSVEPIRQEILALRHQLAVLQRTTPRRPRLRPLDRFLWILLSSVWPSWRQAIQIVTPATVVRWHRRAFALYWRWNSRPRRVGRPALAFR